MKGTTKAIHMVTFILLVIGGLNWLVYALSGWEIGSIFGGMDAIVSKIIYVLVGLSALYEIITHKANCMACTAGGGMKKPEMPKPEMPAGGNQGGAM